MIEVLYFKSEICLFGSVKDWHDFAHSLRNRKPVHPCAGDPGSGEYERAKNIKLVLTNDDNVTFSIDDYSNMVISGNDDAISKLAEEVTMFATIEEEKRSYYHFHLEHLVEDDWSWISKGSMGVVLMYKNIESK